MKPTPEQLARLISEDPNLAPDDIGTTSDLGSLDPADDGSYTTDQTQDTLPGLAWQMTYGSAARVSTQQQVAMLLQRALAEQGSIEAAIEHLTFTPTQQDPLGGCRLELRGGRLIGSDGKRQLSIDMSKANHARAFITVGSMVLTGLVNALSQR